MDKHMQMVREWADRDLEMARDHVKFFLEGCSPETWYKVLDLVYGDAATIRWWEDMKEDHDREPTEMA